MFIYLSYIVNNILSKMFDNKKYSIYLSRKSTTNDFGRALYLTLFSIDN